MTDQATGASPTMLLTYKCRLNPERRQHRALERILEQQRQLYNAALEERIGAWAKGRTVTEVEQSRSLTVIRADDPAFAGVQRRIQRATLQKLDRAYKAFFRRAKAGAGASSGFPKFKGRDWFDGFAFDAFQQIRLDAGGLRFAGMPGKLRVHLDRPLPEISDPATGELRAVIKGVWFKREGRSQRGAARWHVGFQVETPIAASRAGCGTGEVGVDWGTSVLAALSTGEMIRNGRPHEAALGEIARAQRTVARRKKGSKRRRKAIAHLAAIQRRVANSRRNAINKATKRLVTHWATVAVDKIDARGLMNAERVGETLPKFVKVRRNREALDAAPYLMRQMLDYKARRHGADLIVVDAKDTTQLCAWCGLPHYKELSDAVHRCTTPGPFHNLETPRKTNAARVILQRARKQRDQQNSSTRVDDDGGGPVPGGLSGGSDTAVVRNVRTGARRLGNTDEGRPSPGRRAAKAAPPTHTRGPTRPDSTSGW